MRKRPASKAQIMRSNEYRDFVKAFRNDDTEGIKIGRKKGFGISNKEYLDKLVQNFNNIINGTAFPNLLMDKTYELLYPEDINKNMGDGNGRLLDVVSRLFTDVIDLVSEDSDFGKKYFLKAYRKYLMNLIGIGAVLKHKAPVANSITVGTEGMTDERDIFFLLKSVDPYQESDDEESDSDDENSDED